MGTTETQTNGLPGSIRFDVPRSIGVAEASAWMMLARLVVIYGVLVLLVLQQVLRPEFIEPRSIFFGYALLTAGFGFNLLLGLIPARLSEHAAVAGLQIFVDSLLISIWLYLAPEESNPFVLFYLVQTLAVSLLLYRRGSLAVAVTAVVMFAAVVWLRSGSYYTWAVYSGLFLSVGLVGGYLSEELRRATESIQEKSQKIDHLVAFQERILADIPTGLLTIDDQNYIRFVNPAAEHILSCQAKQVVGQKLEKALSVLVPFFAQLETQPVPGEAEGAKETDTDAELSAVGDESHRSYFVRARLGSGQARLQQQVEIGDGTKAKVLRGDVADLTAGEEGQSLVQAHAAMGRVLIFQDVTKLANLETKLRQHEKLAAVGQLAAGIAHEIRNPLASMSASIEMLKGTLTPSASDVENQRLMDIAIREIDRLNRLVSEFLDYVKPEKFQFEKVMLSEMLGEIVMGMRGALERRTIRPAKSDQKVPQIVLVEEYGADAIALGNSEKLRQVIWNLVVNAVQAMQNPGKVRVGCAVRDERSVSFWIADEGQGMSEQTLAHLYEPFFTTKDKGTGLGLAAAYKIVEAHHGEIVVQSKVGQGTRFEVVLQKA